MILGSEEYVEKEKGVRVTVLVMVWALTVALKRKVLRKNFYTVWPIIQYMQSQGIMFPI